MSQNPAKNAQLPASGGNPRGESFRVGFCPTCDKKVLTAKNLAHGDLVDLCVHCDHELLEEAIQWISARSVAGLGYDIDGYGDEDCDSHGGCRGGTCGVRQPGQ